MNPNFGQNFVNNLLNKLNGITLPDLPNISVNIMEILNDLIQSLEDELESLLPLIIVPSLDLGSIVNWIETYIDTVILPIINYIQEIQAYISAMSTVISAIETKIATLGGDFSVLVDIGGTPTLITNANISSVLGSMIPVAPIVSSAPSTLRALIETPTALSAVSGASVTIGGTASCPASTTISLVKVAVAPQGTALSNLTWNTATGTSNWNWVWNLPSGTGDYAIRAQVTGADGSTYRTPARIVHVEN